MCLAGDRVLDDAVCVHSGRCEEGLAGTREKVKGSELTFTTGQSYTAGTDTSSAGSGGSCSDTVVALVRTSQPLTLVRRGQPLTLVRRSQPVTPGQSARRLIMMPRTQTSLDPRFPIPQVPAHTGSGRVMVFARKTRTSARETRSGRCARARGQDAVLSMFVVSTRGLVPTGQPVADGSVLCGAVADLAWVGFECCCAA